MVRKLMTTALILTLGLSLTACGGQDTGTAANRWNWSMEQESLARGPLEDSDSAYRADANGRVKGYDTDSADDHRTDAKEDRDNAGQDLKDAAENAGDAVKDAGDAAKNAARSIGDAAEDALDDATGAAKDAADRAKDAAE